MKADNVGTSRVDMAVNEQREEQARRRNQASTIKITAPSQGVYLPANKDVTFEVEYRDNLGNGIPYRFLDWSVDMPKAQFRRASSPTDGYGDASNVLTTSGIDPDKVYYVRVDVSAVGNQGAEAHGTWGFAGAAANNPLRFAFPDPEGFYPVESKFGFWARYVDSSGGPIDGAQVSWAVESGDAKFADAISTTNDKGFTTNQLEMPQLSVGEQMTVQVSIRLPSVPTADPVVRSFLFVQYPKPNVIEIQSPSQQAHLPFDTVVPVTVRVTNGDGEAMGGELLDWFGGFESARTYTLADGTSTNQLVVETTEGYPGPLERSVTVFAQTVLTAPFTLHFDHAASCNALTFDASQSYDGLPFNQSVPVTVTLRNEFGHALANYAVDWSADNGAVFDQPRTFTDAGGIATSHVTQNVTTPGVTVTVTANAVDASAHAARALHFGQVGDLFELVENKIYAHNPAGSHIDPTNDEQMITLVATYRKDGVPQKDIPIRWQYDANVNYVKFYDRHNNPLGTTTIPPTLTDSDGQAILKVGAEAPYIGQIYAAPPANAFRGVPVVIATLELDAGSYPVIRIPLDDGTLHIPGGMSPETMFMAAIPESTLPTADPNTAVAIWLKGLMAQETIFVTNLRRGREGIPIPYSLLDTVNRDNNFIAYLVEQRAIANTGQSGVLQFDARGNPQTAHPDYSNQNRPFDQPYLDGHATLVNEHMIVGGLNLNIPPYAGFSVGDTISAFAYLNGFVQGTSRAKFNVLPIQYVVQRGDFDDGAPVVLTFSEDDLVGYASYGSQFGTFEADYFVVKPALTTQFWSEILGKFDLDTVPPMRPSLKQKISQMLFAAR